MLYHLKQCKSRPGVQENYACRMVLQNIIEPRHELSNNVVYATSKTSDQPVPLLVA